MCVHPGFFRIKFISFCVSANSGQSNCAGASKKLQIPPMSTLAEHDDEDEIEAEQGSKPGPEVDDDENDPNLMASSKQQQKRDEFAAAEEQQHQVQ